MLHLAPGVLWQISGTTVAGTRKLFGLPSPNDKRHVWVFVLQGRSTAASPDNVPTRAMRHGGYIIYELAAPSMDLLDVTYGSGKWKLPKWVRGDLWNVIGEWGWGWL